jgi:DNA invertase Pin-like site-specific DNA recombinase
MVSKISPISSNTERKGGDDMAKTKQKAKEGKARVLGYLRVSTDEQNAEKNKLAILDHTNRHGLGKVEFIEETISGAVSWKNRALKEVIEGIKEGDVLLVPELSRLGRSLIEVLQVLNICTEKGAKVYSIKEGFQLNGDGLQAKIMRTQLALFAEVERDLLSLRIKEALTNKKASGVRLGRKPGKGRSKLDSHKDEIIALLKNGSTKRFIARKFQSTPANLIHWLRQSKLQDIRPEFEEKPACNLPPAESRKGGRS